MQQSSALQPSQNTAWGQLLWSRGAEKRARSVGSSPFSSASPSAPLSLSFPPCVLLPPASPQVVLFTAGLEDYARPICDEIEARYPGAFHHRLYRPATVAADVYPCIKVCAPRLPSWSRPLFDSCCVAAEPPGCSARAPACPRLPRHPPPPQFFNLHTLFPHPAPPNTLTQDLSRLGRDLHRCVLVDDTPLAFFRQPDHGIPVLQAGAWAGCVAADRLQRLGAGLGRDAPPAPPAPPAPCAQPQCDLPPRFL